MEFFIACGDAVEGFKAGEEILDVVAFNVDVCVEGRLDGAIRFWGDDGDSSTLANEVADRVAVVSLVHNGVSARLEVSLKQGFGLVKVGDVGPSKNESKGVTQGVAGHVNFCRYAGAGPSHGLGDLAANGV